MKKIVVVLKFRKESAGGTPIGKAYIYYINSIDDKTDNIGDYKAPIGKPDIEGVVSNDMW